MKTYRKLCVACGKEISYNHGDKPLVCPYCSEDRWDKPIDEYNLFLLQDLYLSKRDSKTLSKMWEIIYNYSKRIAISKYRKTGKYFNQICLHENATDMASNLVEKYISFTDFKIDNSFGGYLNWVANGVLYGNKEEEHHISLSEYFDIECMSNAMSVLEVVTPDFDKISIVNKEVINDKVINLINKCFNYINEGFSIKDSLLVLYAVKHTINGKSDKFINNFYDVNGWGLKVLVEKVMSLVYLGLKNEQYELVGDSV